MTQGSDRRGSHLPITQCRPGGGVREHILHRAPLFSTKIAHRMVALRWLRRFPLAPNLHWRSSAPSEGLEPPALTPPPPGGRKQRGAVAGGGPPRASLMEGPAAATDAAAGGAEERGALPLAEQLAAVRRSPGLLGAYPALADRSARRPVIHTPPPPPLCRP